MSAGDDGPVTQSPDTSPEIEALLIARLREMTPAQRYRLVADQSAADDAHARVGIRLRHPDADEREVRLRLAAQKYGRELVLEAFGWDIAEQGW